MPEQQFVRFMRLGDQFGNAGFLWLPSATPGQLSVGLYGDLKMSSVIKTVQCQGSDVTHQGIHVFIILAYWHQPDLIIIPEAIHHTHTGALHKHSLKQQKSTDPQSGRCPTVAFTLPTVSAKDAHSTLQSSEALHRTSNLYLLAICSHSLTGCSSLFTSSWPPAPINPYVSAHGSRACVCCPGKGGLQQSFLPSDAQKILSTVYF